MLAHTTRRAPHISAWMLRQETWLRQRLQQRILRHAQQRALQRFALQHPHWAESLFDDFFLTHGAALLIAGYLTPHQRPTAAELASAWAADTARPRSSTRPLDLSDVTPVAAAFLHMLDAELEPYQSVLF